MEAEAVFIAVGTPSRRGDGHADLSYVYAAAREIAAGNPKLNQINNNWRC
jgi:UDPglucose 6-dehydrogenase